jgi:hypothetical protein
MTCEFCGGETVKKRVRKVHWLRRILYIVDDVEAWRGKCLERGGAKATKDAKREGGAATRRGFVLRAPGDAQCPVPHPIRSLRLLSRRF